MNAKQILAKLKPLGDKSMHKANQRFGVGKDYYGVKLGDLRKLAKEIKKNHELAMELWGTGNADARMLAILCMKPKALSAEELDALVRADPFTRIADWLNSYIVKGHPASEELREGWMDDTNPLAARAGWNLTAIRVAKDPDGLDLKGLLDRIEAEMADAPEESQWTMNICLAEIGIHHPKFRKRALAIGEKLGVYSDYPTAKGCTSPYAPEWINEMVSRQA